MTTTTLPELPEPMTEIRTLPLLLEDLEVRAGGVTSHPIISGLIPYYDGSPQTEARIDAHKYERISPGAFREAIRRGDDPAALINHDPSLILGRRSAGTLRLFEEQRGLRFEILPPATQLGRQVTESIRRGDMTGASFAFRAERQEFKTERRSDGAYTIRTLLQVALGDLSIATYPAYAASRVGLAAPETPTEIVNSTPKRNIGRRRLQLLK